MQTSDKNKEKYQVEDYKLIQKKRLTKALPWPVGRDRKILTGLGTNQIARFVTVPSQKKIKNKIV